MRSGFEPQLMQMTDTLHGTVIMLINKVHSAIKFYNVHIDYISLKTNIINIISRVTRTVNLYAITVMTVHLVIFVEHNCTCLGMRFFLLTVKYSCYFLFHFYHCSLKNIRCNITIKNTLTNLNTCSMCLAN